MNTSRVAFVATCSLLGLCVGGCPTNTMGPLDEEAGLNSTKTQPVPGPPGPKGDPGVACWDVNGNGIADPEEDVNGDGTYDALDCRGEPGPKGDPGLACWDLNGNGEGDPNEDLNGDGVFDAADCQGPQGVPGPPGPTDLVFWGTFSGLPPVTVFETGGKAELLSFERTAPGVYKVVLDWPRDPDEGVAILASGTGFNVTLGVNSGVVMSTNIDFNAPGDRLTIEVVAVEFINDPIFGYLVASNSDTIFSLLVFDEESN